MPRSGPTIAEIAAATIRAAGPQDTDSLTGAVVAAGRSKARDPRAVVHATLADHPWFIRDWDDRWCVLADQLEGAVFSARLTEFERRHEIVLMRDSLSLPRPLAIGRGYRSGRSFHGGGVVRLDMVGPHLGLPHPDPDRPSADIVARIDDELAGDIIGFLRELEIPYGDDRDHGLNEFLDEMRYEFLLTGPPGWLPPIRHDGLLGIGLRNGEFTTMALDRRDVRGPHVALAGTRMAAIARRVIGPDPSWFGPEVMRLRDLLELVAAEAPEVFRRPLPPLDEVLIRAGLEVEDGLVGHLGTDWDAWDLGVPLDPASAWGYDPPDRIS